MTLDLLRILGIEPIDRSIDRHNLYPHVVKSYLIKSRLEFVKGDWNTAFDHLETAKSFTSQKNLDGLLKEVKTAELLMNTEHKEFISRKTDFSERLQRMKLLDYIKKAQGMRKELTD